MVTPIKFTHDVSIQNTVITGEPGENRGLARTEMDLLFTVRASLGAVQLRVRLITSDMEGLPAHYKASSPVSVSSHFKRKLSDWWIDSEKCDVLEQGHCFGDTSYFIAEEAWAAFCRTEEEGWKFLEDTYNVWRKP